MTELRQAFRSLRKSPGFCATAILTLALGICASTTMFSVLRAIVLEPFSYPNAERIVALWSSGGQPLSTPDYFDLLDRSRSFESLGCYTVRSFNLGGAQSQTVKGVLCTGSVLAAYGSPRPVLGRWFTEEDQKVGAPAVVVLNHSLWEGTFGGDPTLVGRQVRIDGENATVVGIMPKGFEFVSPWMRTSSCQLWLPLALEPGKGSRTNHWLCAVARLKQGVTVHSADAEAKAIGAQLMAEHADSNFQKSFFARSLHEEMVGGKSRSVWFLFGAMQLVLLASCANVSGMLLARNIQRRGDQAVRQALGASRLQLVRLSLTESLLLALGGAALGVFLSLFSIETLAALTPTSPERRAAMSVDLTVLAFSFGTAFLSAHLVALPSAVASLRSAKNEFLRGDSRSMTLSRERHLMLNSLIAIQVVFAFMLTYAAALFSSSYLKTLDANRSLSTERVLAASVELKGPKYAGPEQRMQFWNRLSEQVATLPGVTASGLTSKLPLEGGSHTDILVNDEVFDPTVRRTLVETSSVTPGYFAAMGIPVLRGRDREPLDEKADNCGVVVNRTLAEKSWPGQNPIGKALRGNGPKPLFTAQVVGVVEDVRQFGPDKPAAAEIYWAPERYWGRTVFIVLRSERPAAQLVPSLRKMLASLDPDLPLAEVRTLKEVVERATLGQRSLTQSVNVFMGLSLVLLAIGVYGTLSYQVTSRVREIGIRLALGARRGDIERLVVRQNAQWVLLGGFIGGICALVLSKTLQTAVYGVEETSLGALALALAVIALVALLASWLPALRAGRLDPVEALRAD